MYEGLIDYGHRRIKINRQFILHLVLIANIFFKVMVEWLSLVMVEPFFYWYSSVLLLDLLIWSGKLIWTIFHYFIFEFDGEIQLKSVKKRVHILDILVYFGYEIITKSRNHTLYYYWSGYVAWHDHILDRICIWNENAVHRNVLVAGVWYEAKTI